jgi:hypothetical protein
MSDTTKYLTTVNSESTTELETTETTTIINSIPDITENLTIGASESTTELGTTETTTILDTTENSTTNESESTTELQTCDRDSDTDFDSSSVCTGCLSVYSRAHPKSRDKYIICKEGVGVVMKCGPGLKFDVNRLTCDYPGLVEQELIYSLNK